MGVIMAEEKKELSNRSKQRLKIAAGLLRKSGVELNVKRDVFYPHILGVIEALPEDQKQKLKSNVDWVEDYENASPKDEKSAGR